MFFSEVFLYFCILHVILVMPACLRNVYMRHHTCIDYLVSRLRNTWLAGRPLSPPLNYFPTPALWFMMEMKPWGLVDHIFPIFRLALTFCKVSGFYYFSFFFIQMCYFDRWNLDYRAVVVVVKGCTERHLWHVWPDRQQAVESWGVSFVQSVDQWPGAGRCWVASCWRFGSFLLSFELITFLSRS